MGTEAAHGDVEVQIFAEFVRRGALAIDLASIQKRFSPFPDILCSHATEGLMSFELAELCAEDLARMMAKPGESDFLWTSDPSERILRKKVQKSYQVDGPLELLLYTNGRIVTPDDVIIPTIRPILQSSSGQFRRVWLMGDSVYEVWSAS